MLKGNAMKIKYVSQKVRKNGKKSNINSMKAEERIYQGKDINQQTRATGKINKKYVFFLKTNRI